MKLKLCALIAVLSFSCTVHAIGKTYIVRTEEQGGRGAEAELARQMQKLDQVAAAKGDKLSMARVAQECFSRGDYQCAYKNSLMSLTSRYWWQFQKVPLEMLALHDRARSKISSKDAKRITQEVREALLKDVPPGKIPEDDMASKSPKEWETYARKGKIFAAGHLAQKCFKEKDFVCAYKWATIGSIGAVWQIKGSNMLAYRYHAMQKISDEDFKKANIEILGIIRSWGN